jgi:predicted amidohydrolase
MTEKIRAACIQMTSGPDIAANLETAEMYIRQAAKQGASFIATPENTDQIRHPASEKLKTAPPPESHPGISLFSNLAKELSIWLLAGSFAVKTGDKLANRSMLFSPDGKTAAQYDKIHLFDIDLPNGEKYRESDVIQSGDKTAIAQTPFGVVGLTVCYDVRFAYLFRKLAQAGREYHHRAVRLHRADRPRALGNPAPRPRYRNRQLHSSRPARPASTKTAARHGVIP